MLSLLPPLLSSTRSKSRDGVFLYRVSAPKCARASIEYFASHGIFSMGRGKKKSPRVIFRPRFSWIETLSNKLVELISLDLQRRINEELNNNNNNKKIFVRSAFRHSVLWSLISPSLSPLEIYSVHVRANEVSLTVLRLCLSSTRFETRPLILHKKMKKSYTHIYLYIYVYISEEPGLAPVYSRVTLFIYTI